MTINNVNVKIIFALIFFGYYFDILDYSYFYLIKLIHKLYKKNDVYYCLSYELEILMLYFSMLKLLYKIIRVIFDVINNKKIYSI